MLCWALAPSVHLHGFANGAGSNSLIPWLSPFVLTELAARLQHPQALLVLPAQTVFAKPLLLVPYLCEVASSEILLVSS